MTTSRSSGRIRILIRTAACAVIAMLMLYVVAERPVQAQVPPLFPTAPARPPLGEPRPAATTVPTSAPSTAVDDNLPPDPAVIAAETPISEDETAVRAYAVRGSLGVTTQTTDGASNEQRREYEISMVAAAQPSAPSVDRHYRLRANENDSPVWEMATYEVGNAAVTITGPGEWSIQPRQSPMPLLRALQPVLDLADLAYTSCTGLGEDPASDRDLRSEEVCVFTDSGRVASLLAGYDESVRVTASLLAVRLDRELGVTARYLLTADVERNVEGAEPATYSIEWTYERADSVEEGPTDAGQLAGLSTGIPPLDALESPIISLDAWPASEYTLSLAQNGDVLHVDMSLTVEQAREDLSAALQQNGWRVQEADAALTADRGVETVVVLLAEGIAEGTVTVDLVRLE